MQSVWRYQFVLALLFCSGITLAGVPANKWQVTELRLNKPAVAGGWYASNSPLNRGLHIKRGYIAVYAVEVLPGLQYTLQVSVVHHLQGIRAYLYDRWPLLPGAHQIALPNGPVVLTPHSRHITYRWRLGISAHSTGNVLYVVVHSSGNPAKRRDLLPRIEVRSSPISSRHRIGNGITYLSGPLNLVLADDSTAVTYTLQPDQLSGQHPVSADASTVDDLISNGRFRFGMKNWVPTVGATTGGREPIANAKGLCLPPASGVEQELDADVGHADSLLLQVAMRLEPGAGSVHAVANGPGLAIELCYRDRWGKAHCGANGSHMEFHIRPEKATTAANTDSSQKYLPAGQWYRYQADLMRIKPAPVRIKSLSLSTSDGEGMAWIREVHMIIRRVEHATH